MGTGANMLDSLLLTPCRISSEEEEDDEDDQFHLNPFIWRQLPESLLHRVLAWLPFKSVLRFRSVCKQWKALFASPGFHHFPSHKAYVPPWLFLLSSNIDHHHSLSLSCSQISKGEYEIGMSCKCKVHRPPCWDSHGNIVRDLLLIFNCESESWHRPLPFPSGFKRSCNHDNSASFDICSFQEQVLIPSISAPHLYLYNPAVPSCQELPSFISIQGLPGALGFAEERAPLSSSVKLPSLQHLSSMMRIDKAGKHMQVVAVGKSRNGTLVLEVFHSSRGSWQVCGNLPSDIAFSQRRMVYCNGFFYALPCRPRTQLLSLNSIIVGQNIEWALQDCPVLPNQDGNQHTALGRLHLVACGNRVLLIGATLSHSTNRRRRRHGQHIGEQLHILIWQFHPDADSDNSWELLAEMPRQIFHAFYGKKSFVHIECCGHGDLVFFQDKDSCQILMYYVAQDDWKFSPRCEYDIDALAFVWEPLVN